MAPIRHLARALALATLMATASTGASAQFCATCPAIELEPGTKILGDPSGAGAVAFSAARLAVSEAKMLAPMGTERAITVPQACPGMACAIIAHASDEGDELRVGVKKMTKQLSDLLLKQIETTEAMMTGEQKLRAKREREKLDYEARQTFLRQPRASCISGTAMTQIPGGRALTGSVRRQISQNTRAFDGNATVQTSGSASAIASIRLNEREDKYCSQLDADRKLCPQVVEERLQNADLNASTLFDRGTLDAPLQEAAIDFCSNMIRPVPPPALSNAALNTPGGEIANIRRLSFDSRVSLAREVCNHLIAFQTETMDLKEWAEAVEIDPESINENAEGISMQELMRIEIARRYGNPNWLTETLGRDALPINVRKEIIMMMGLKLYLDWERYHMARYNAMTTATLIASQANTEFYTVGGTRAGSQTSTIE